MASNTKDTSPDRDAIIRDYDVLIVGAGISGISAAYHVQTNFPEKSYRIVEGRDDWGGTWDLFRYPGIRSDSDMFTFGFAFRPWNRQEIIVEAPAILEYLHETVKECDLERRVDFGTRVQTADWDSHRAKWTLSATKDESVTYRARHVFVCTGYYNYERGYQPTFPNQEVFPGPIVHPQHWPSDLDYTDKKIVVIGSGATAITLIPSLTKTAQHVTMVQRSPTYIAAKPATATKLAQFIARNFGHAVCRWYFIGLSMLTYWVCRTFPKRIKQILIQEARALVGEKRWDACHFTPRYDPWDQRVCLSPDGDFFAAIRSGKADIVTDHIQEFTAQGIRLRDSQQEIPADIIVTATGLQLLFGGGIQMTVDGQPMVPNTKLAYKGFMLDGVPNLFLAAGYTNNSWTLKVDLTNAAACRLIAATERRGAKFCQPELPRGDKLPILPLLDLQSGYVRRNAHQMPNQSDRLPWKLHQNYVKDKILLEYMPLEDETIQFY